jgi:AbrB family looped-hinge helix DNA binding protein
MKSRMRVGEKGQVVIPKAIREETGIKEGTEVLVEANDGGVLIRRAGPPTENYTDYFTATFSKKLDHEVSTKMLLEEEKVGRQKHIH